jgi:hypothetical protein
METSDRCIFPRESKVTKNGWAEDVTRGKSVYGELNRCGVSPGRRIKKSISVDRGTTIYSYSAANNFCGLLGDLLAEGEETIHGEEWFSFRHCSDDIVHLQRLHDDHCLFCRNQAQFSAALAIDFLTGGTVDGGDAIGIFRHTIDRAAFVCWIYRDLSCISPVSTSTPNRGARIKSIS